MSSLKHLNGPKKHPTISVQIRGRKNGSLIITCNGSLASSSSFLLFNWKDDAQCKDYIRKWVLKFCLAYLMIDGTAALLHVCTATLLQVCTAVLLTCSHCQYINWISQVVSLPIKSFYNRFRLGAFTGTKRAYNDKIEWKIWILGHYLA